MTDQDTAAEEGGEGDPVLGIGDGEPAYWRQKKEAVEESAEDGEIDGVSKAPAGGGDEDQGKEAKRDGGLVDTQEIAEARHEQESGDRKSRITQEHPPGPRCILLHDRR